MNYEFINLALALFVGLGGWFIGRMKDAGEVAKWRATVDAKLDLLLDLQKSVDSLGGMIHGQDIRILMVENTLKSFNDIEKKVCTLDDKVDAYHRRLDELEKFTK